MQQHQRHGEVVEDVLLRDVNVASVAIHQAFILDAASGVVEQLQIGVSEQNGHALKCSLSQIFLTEEWRFNRHDASAGHFSLCLKLVGGVFDLVILLVILGWIRRSKQVDKSVRGGALVAFLVLRLLLAP